MRLMRCTLLEGATITVQGAEVGRTFRGGDVVDVDAAATPAVGTRAAQSWAEALGHHLEDAFEAAATKTTGLLGPAVRPIAAPAHEE